jgi:class 3 adenylate cyclase
VLGHGIGLHVGRRANRNRSEGSGARTLAMQLPPHTSASNTFPPNADSDNMCLLSSGVVKSSRKRSKPAMSTMHTFGPFRLDAETQMLFRGAEPVALGQRAVALLRVLVERPGTPVSKDALIEAAWSGLAVQDSNLTVQIAALRRVLEEVGGAGWIETLPRRGYRFVGPAVTKQGNGVAIGLPLAAAVDIAAAQHSPNASTLPDRRSIAILPFTNMSGRHSDENLDQQDQERHAHFEPERRQLTVMSCELVGATRFAGMDLEDLREVIGAYRRCVADTVARRGGVVGQQFGNTVQVFFGHPATHEDDAEQAVRAGLELCAAIGALKPRGNVTLRCRVGAATGPVIVGNLIGGGKAQEREIVGEALDTATRLQILTQPGVVAIECATRQLIGDMFDLRKIELLGADQSIQTWHVLGERTVESRFEALHSAAVAPLVGRTEELEMLQRRWRQAARGEGRVVLLSGEPGIGKSRTVRTFLDRLPSETYTRLSYSCSPHHQDSALHPFIAQLERRRASLVTTRPRRSLRSSKPCLHRPPRMPRNSR